MDNTSVTETSTIKNLMSFIQDEKGNTAVTEASTSKNLMSLTQDEKQNTNSILCVLFLVIAALFLFAVLVFIIKYGCCRICTITWVFAALFLFAVLVFIIKYVCSQKTYSIMYVLFLVIAALFLFAVLVSIIKYGCSQVFGAFFPCAVLGFTIKYGCSRICGVRRRVVGIFSYSSPEDYLWITQGLESPMFRGSVEKTLSLIISNNINSRSKYREAVEKCDFAILYHTKNRGRINLTNVTDSLYDEEIKHMSLCKGRKNVIVVVDDLEKSGYEEKYCILDTQPDISKYAQDLILVSSKDKKNQQGINNKLQQILDLMSDESMKPIQYCDYLSSMTRWVCNTIMCCPHQSSREGLYAIISHPHQSSREGLDAPLLA